MYQMVTKKAFCIFVLMLFSFSVSVSNVLAGSFSGGEGCPICGQQEHHPDMGAKAHSMPNRCLPGAQGIACGIENGRITDTSRFFIASVRVDNHESSGISDTLRDEYNKVLFLGGPIPRTLFSLKTAPSIYLLNHSLLC
jgi:hypothetical protein